MVNIDRFDSEYFRNLKSNKEKEDYFIKFIQKSFGIIERGGVPNDD